MLGNPVEGERRFRWEGEQFLSPSGMAFGLERNVFHRRTAGGCSDAGQSPGIETPSMKEDRVPARRKSMRKVKEVLRLRFELGLGAAPDRTQLRNGAGHGPRVSGTGGGSRDRLAVAGRLGRRRAGSQAVWEPARADRNGATATATGLEC